MQKKQLYINNWRYQQNKNITKIHTHTHKHSLSLAIIITTTTQKHNHSLSIHIGIIIRISSFILDFLYIEFKNKNFFSADYLNWYNWNLSTLTQFHCFRYENNKIFSQIDFVVFFLVRLFWCVCLHAYTVSIYLFHTLALFHLQIQFSLQ